MKGLHLLDFDRGKIKVSPDVQSEVDRLRREPVVPCVTDLQHISSPGFVVVFHNSQSLHKHIGDIRMERNLLQANLLFFFETWEQEHDKADYYSLPDFTLVARNRAPTKSLCPHNGTLVYARDCSILYSIKVRQKCSSGIEITVVDTSSSIAGLGVVGVYCAQVSITVLCAELRAVTQQVLTSHTHVIIGGDFNSDASVGLLKQLQEFCDHFSLRQLITDSTTDYGTTLDLIFTNLP